MLPRQAIGMILGTLYDAVNANAKVLSCSESRLIAVKKQHCIPNNLGPCLGAIEAILPCKGCMKSPCKGCTKAHETP